MELCASTAPMLVLLQILSNLPGVYSSSSSLDVAAELPKVMKQVEEMKARLVFEDHCVQQCFTGNNCSGTHSDGMFMDTVCSQCRLPVPPTCDFYKNANLTECRQKLCDPTNSGLPLLARGVSSSLPAFKTCSKQCDPLSVCANGLCECRSDFLDISPPGTSGRVCLEITTAGCEHGWRTLMGTQGCYEVFQNTSISMNSALEECLQAGGHLASVSSESLAKFLAGEVKSKIKESGTHKKVWIGLIYDIKQKTWSWTDGSDLKFTAWYYDFPDLPDNLPEDGLYCAQAVGSDYGMGRWVTASCNDTLASGFICRMSRNVPKGEDPLMLRRTFEITCCSGGKPKLNPTAAQVIRDWRSENIGSTSYDSSCLRYSGSYSVPRDIFFKRDFSWDISCECKDTWLDRNCHDPRPCLNSGYRAYKINLRCVCHEPYFGTLCEKMCRNGKRTKVNGIDECLCDSLFYGEECDKIKCLNGGTPAQHQRSCTCPTHMYVGRHCEHDRSGGRHDDVRATRSSIFRRDLFGTATGVLFVIGIALTVYCLARRRANHLARQLHQLRTQQSVTSATYLNSGGAPLRPEAAEIPHSPPEYSQAMGRMPCAIMPMNELGAPPSYEDIFKEQASPRQTLSNSQSSSIGPPYTTEIGPGDSTEAPTSPTAVSSENQSDRTNSPPATNTVTSTSIASDTQMSGDNASATTRT